MKVGTKELKNRLSHYLRLVQQGEPVQVTDRGAVVAELRPLHKAEGDDACLQALEREGLLSVGKRKRLPAFEPLSPKRGKLLSELVIEDRE